MFLYFSAYKNNNAGKVVIIDISSYFFDCKNYTVKVFVGVTSMSIAGILVYITFLAVFTF